MLANVVIKQTNKHKNKYYDQTFFCILIKFYSKRHIYKIRRRETSCYSWWRQLFFQNNYKLQICHHLWCLLLDFQFPRFFLESNCWISWIWRLDISEVVERCLFSISLGNRLNANKIEKKLCYYRTHQYIYNKPFMDFSCDKKWYSYRYSCNIQVKENYISRQTMKGAIKTA